MREIRVLWSDLTNKQMMAGMEIEFWAFSAAAHIALLLIMECPL